MRWKIFEGRVEGTRIRGNPEIPVTRWWNQLFLYYFYWYEFMELCVHNRGEPYYVGYFDKSKNVYFVSTVPERSRIIGVRIRSEERIFFAINEKGVEIPLRRNREKITKLILPVGALEF